MVHVVRLGSWQILMEYLLVWLHDVLCLIISPVMLTMLLAALLKSDVLS